jgi:hypothetical protein
VLPADLRRLYRTASGVSLDGEILPQTAQAAKHRDLLALAQRCHAQTLRQTRWANAMLKEPGPSGGRLVLLAAAEPPLEGEDVVLPVAAVAAEGADGHEPAGRFEAAQLAEVHAEQLGCLAGPQDGHTVMHRVGAHVCSNGAPRPPLRPNRPKRLQTSKF